MDKKSKGNNTWHNVLAIILLFVCAFALLFSLILLVIHSYGHHIDVQRVELCYVPVDSTLTSKVDLIDESLLIPKASVDSIVSLIETHEAQLSQKYQYIIEKREEEENYRNIFMLIFGIAVSTVGFFGYRSFSDIDNRAMTIANEKAEEVAKTESPIVAKAEAEATARKYCEENVNDFVQAYLNDNLQNAVNGRVSEIYNGQGKDAIIAEITRNLDTQLKDFLDSEAGCKLIRNQIDIAMDDNSHTNESESRIADSTPNIETTDKTSSDNSNITSTDTSTDTPSDNDAVTTTDTTADTTSKTEQAAQDNTPQNSNTAPSDYDDVVTF